MDGATEGGSVASPEAGGQVLRAQIFQAYEAYEAKLRIRFDSDWAFGKHK